MRTLAALSIALMMAGAIAIPSDTFAAQCRDASGKFIKCAAVKPPTKCRDVKTKKFAKCGLPGTEPVP